MDEYVAWFETLSSGDVGRLGGENASLGEPVRALKAEKLGVALDRADR